MSASLGACHSGSSTPAATGSPAAAPSAAPTPTSPAQVDPAFDMGQTIFITNDGFQPAWLVSIVGLPVTWKNVSSHPIALTSLDGYIDSGTIAPGATWTWLPKTIRSETYHQVGDKRNHGAVQVSQKTEF